MKTLRILGLLAIVALVLSGCPAAPQVVEKEVVKEVPVEVVVTATPAPLVAGEDIVRSSSWVPSALRKRQPSIT